MAIDPSVQRRMTFSGDYGMDKWVVYKTGSVTASSGGGLDRSIVAHNLGYTPLIYVQWSETSDFSVPRELLQNSGDLYSISEPWIIRSAADEVNVYFYLQNWGASSKTIYYRIWGLPPHNVSQKVTPTGDISGLSPLVFNGEQNYLKPYLSGIATVSSGSSTVNINHNLGYVPTVMVWIEGDVFIGVTPQGLMIAPPPQPIAYNPYSSLVPFNITNSTMSFYYDYFLMTTSFHYKIYVEPIYE